MVTIEQYTKLNSDRLHVKRRLDGTYNSLKVYLSVMSKSDEANKYYKSRIIKARKNIRSDEKWLRKLDKRISAIQEYDLIDYSNLDKLDLDKEKENEKEG